MKKFALLVSLVLLPSIALAQTTGTTGGQRLTGVIATLGELVNLLIPILVALALLVFFWGLVKYIWNSGSEEGQEQGKKIMIAGIVALFVMVSIWGIIRIIGSTFQVEQGGQVNPPSVNIKK